MSIAVYCSCGKGYQVQDHLAGRAVKCKQCGEVFRIPAAVEEAEIDYSLPPEPYDVAGGVAYAGAADPAGYVTPQEGSSWDPALQQPSQYDALSAMAINQSTYATNSGRMRVSFAKFFTCHPTGLIFAIALVVLGVASAAILWHPALLFLSGVGIYMFVQECIQVRGKFLGGDVNPAVVISANPWRVAVFANMTKGHGFRPAINIFNAPLGRMTGGPPKVGMPLATVSLYTDAPGDAWGDFQPTVINCGLTQRQDIDRVLHSISPSEWRQLQSHLDRLPDRRPGLYKLWISTENAFPDGLRQKLAKVALVLICLVPVAAIVIHIVKKFSDDRARVSQSEPTRSSQPRPKRPSQPPPEQVVPRLAAPEEPAKPVVKPPVERNLWGDINGGSIEPEPTTADSPKKSELAPGVVMPKAPMMVVDAPATKPAGPEATGTAAATKDSLEAQPARKPQPGLVAPDEAEPAAPAMPPRPVSPARPRLLPRTRPTLPGRQGAPALEGDAKPSPAIYKVGQKVEAQFAATWKKATILRVEGDQYRIRFDELTPGFDRTVEVDQIRRRQ